MSFGFSADESLIVDGFNKLDKTQKLADFWNDDATNSVRSKIKKFLVSAQRSKCCYCRRDLGTEHGRIWDIEHVACRSIYPQFMFEYKNLSVSCIECNSHKSDQDVVKNGRRLVHYPKDGKFFTIVHPAYDKYGEHISWHNQIIPIPFTDKGRKTIYVCDLMRFAQRLANIAEPVGDRRFEAEVDVVFSPTHSTEEREEAKAALSDAIEAALLHPIPI